MSGEECNICGMKVSNMKVHMKLNHKKRKSITPEGFRFTGNSSSTSAPTTLTNVTKYQKTQATQYKGLNIEPKKTEKSHIGIKFRSLNSGTSDSEVRHSAREEKCLHGDERNRETPIKICS